ncbi:ketopantoate reductase family protein [Cellulomonas endophytica]|uniref:ketopantoate reductase family protein n=1 Tax=Cellulomonas endophytica TaxID=2494735 RepID=UPI00101067AA|nr:2-dehydropantoate 2-reductase N-terminal domain-containing protein [Cellulomonas endophytica]
MPRTPDPGAASAPVTGTGPVPGPAPTPRRLVVLGAGAVGLTLAARATEAGVPVLLVARGAALERLRTAPVRYADPDGVREVRVPVAAEDEVALEPSDVLVLTVKAQQAEDALTAWAYREVAGGGLGADLPVVTLQNGLDTERAALRRFTTVLSASILVPAQSFAPGEVATAAAGPAAVLTLGPAGAGPHPPATHAALADVAAALVATGCAAHVVEDAAPWKALKLLGNVLNGVEVLAGDEDARAALGREVVEEARAVLDAAGLAVADGAERERAVGAVRVRRTEGWEPGRSSTFQSFARGAASVETDHLNGEVVLLARLHGVPAPLNAALQRVLGRAAARGEGPGSATVADVRAAAAG